MVVYRRADRLQEHISGTYASLRLGVGVIGAVLPVLLWLGGWIGDSEPLRSSMSAYYYSPTMGDTFVGILVTVGVAPRSLAVWSSSWKLPVSGSSQSIGSSRAENSGKRVRHASRWRASSIGLRPRGRLSRALWFKSSRTLSAWMTGTAWSTPQPDLEAGAEDCGV